MQKKAPEKMTVYKSERSPASLAPYENAGEVDKSLSSLEKQAPGVVKIDDKLPRKKDKRRQDRKNRRDMIARIRKRLDKYKESPNKRKMRVMYLVTVCTVAAVTLMCLLGMILAGAGVIGKAKPLVKKFETTCNDTTCWFGKCEKIDSNDKESESYCRCLPGYRGSQCAFPYTQALADLQQCNLDTCQVSMKCAPRMGPSAHCFLPPTNKMLTNAKHQETEDSRSDIANFGLDKYERKLELTTILIAEPFNESVPKEALDQIVRDPDRTKLEKEQVNPFLIISLYPSVGGKLAMIMFPKVAGYTVYECKNCDYVGLINFAEVEAFGFGNNSKVQLKQMVFTYKSKLHFQGGKIVDLQVEQPAFGLYVKRNCVLQRNGIRKKCVLSTSKRYVDTDWSQWSECDVCSGTRSRYKVILERIPDFQLSGGTFAYRNLWDVEKACNAGDDVCSDKYLYANRPCNGARCSITNDCIRSEQICDGNIDCPHGEDERGCTNVGSGCKADPLPGINQLGMTMSFFGDDGLIGKALDTQFTGGGCPTISISSDENRKKPKNVIQYKYEGSMSYQLKVRDSQSAASVTTNTNLEKGLTEDTEVTTDTNVKENPAIAKLNKEMKEEMKEMVRRIQVKEEIPVFKFDDNPPRLKDFKCGDEKNEPTGCKYPKISALEKETREDQHQPLFKPNVDSQGYNETLQQYKLKLKNALNKFKSASDNYDNYLENQRLEMEKRQAEFKAKMEQWKTQLQELSKFENVNHERIHNRTVKMYSESTRKVIESVLNENKSVFSVNADIILSTFKLDALDPILDKVLKSRFLQLPPFLHVEYHRLFDDYGTHVVTAGKLGGKFQVLFEHKSKFQSDNKNIQKFVNNCVEKEASRLDSVTKADATAATKDTARRETSKAVKQCKDTNVKNATDKDKLESTNTAKSTIFPLPHNSISVGNRLEDFSEVLSSWIHTVRNDPHLVEATELKSICHFLQGDDIPQAEMKQVACEEARILYSKNRLAPCICPPHSLAFQSTMDDACRCIPFSTD